MARVLIVEDELLVAADIQHKLRLMGHEVVAVATSAEESIDIAGRMAPDLVLMDVKLAGEMSGTEAAEIIYRRVGCQVVFLTAFPGVFLRDPTKMAEPGICLSKPFSSEQLEAAVDAALWGRSGSVM